MRIITAKLLVYGFLYSLVLLLGRWKFEFYYFNYFRYNY